uniref:1-phosphatidylinositol-3-phosphate 5-kinase n=1 Tax=Oryza punctata TaxID=4537 RepID=A0A0E0M102_ORYPU
MVGAVEKVRSIVASHAPGHVEQRKGAAAADGEARRRYREEGAPRPRSPESPSVFEPPTPPRRASEARSGTKRDAAPCSPPPCCDIRRADEEIDEPRVQFFAPGTYFSHDFSDTDSSVSVANSMYRSVTPSPSESPTVRQNYASDHGATTMSDSDDAREHVSASIASWCEEDHKSSRVVDFGDDIWYPPPPEDESDDIESKLCAFDDEDNEYGDSSNFFVPNCFSADKFAGVDGAVHGSHIENVQNDLLRHFQALVAQLLTGEAISLARDRDSKGWLEIVSSLAWQAANFVKPDTKKGGSMDPSDYVKIKCIASGKPSESNFVKGIVCSKNVKHKRMVSEHQNATLLILGGALEYQKVSNKLASIGTILEQEKEHLRMIVGKIESRRPNVLLVEKSVSSYAQELLAKDISLVLNVKRPLLDRISRCTGGQIASSIDNIASARLGHCDTFKVEKVLDSSTEHSEKKSTKTLMFFDGCMKRLGCTVLLRGACWDELKRIKRVIQLAVFAAYHLSLETSFFADEGATLPRVPSTSSVGAPEVQTNTEHLSSRSANHGSPVSSRAEEEKYSHNASISQIFNGISGRPTFLPLDGESQGIVSEHREVEYPVNHIKSVKSFHLRHPNALCNVHSVSLGNDLGSIGAVTQHYDPCNSLQSPVGVSANIPGELHNLENCGSPVSQEDFQVGSLNDQNKLSGGYFPGTDNHQSILVSFSSTCIPKSLACERSHLFRIKFYGSFDKPLGRYLREDLFDQAYCCPSCKEHSESHVRCYMHQHGSLTISVRHLISQKLPGEHDGRIWMWHRCTRCKLEDGMPPASQRVIMSDAAWGLSFGKFLELSFSNHATANRIASCGHSLQRDCLRFYGYGNMVAVFQYSPMVTLSVNLPPSMLDFNCHSIQEWVKGEAVVVFGEMESLHAEVYGFLSNTEKSIFTMDESIKAGIERQIIEMKDLLNMERNEYEVTLLLPVIRGSTHSMKSSIDILELNRLRRGLLLDAYIWDCRLCNISSIKKDGDASGIKDSEAELHQAITKHGEMHQEPSTCPRCSSGNLRKSLVSREDHSMDTETILPEIDFPLGMVDSFVHDVGGLDLVFSKFDASEKRQSLSKDSIKTEPVERLPSLASILSDKIDMAWSGSCELHNHLPESMTKGNENPSYSKAIPPVRIHSFDSIFRFHQRELTGLLPASLHLPSKSADSFRDLTSLVKDPLTNMRRAFSHISPRERGNLNVLTHLPTYIRSAAHMVNDGARLLLPHMDFEGGVVVAVYDDEPTSIVCYAMTSQEYIEHITHKMDTKCSFHHPVNCAVASSNQFEESLFPQEGHSEFKGTHFSFSFDDEAFSADNTKFSVTCYFARQFAALRKKCCPNDIDYIRSLSRCKRWSAQGGKSNVYFAKTMDERFIIKQVTKTELDSFVGFAPHYFRHLTESLTSKSPTCLAKIMGLYQVSIKGLKGGREVKMDLMVMENIFFQRAISRVYDLKGSVRSRYNSDTSGHNKVLLDSNLIEALHTNPIFLGSKAKQRMERAVWNDTSFLASLDVMDYSLLVGVDEKKNELVIGIIDFLRQYTWDKQLETWVKASGILGGPKNEAPTVISPIQYKKRFRKAMSRYFLAVPDDWSSS